MLVALPAAIAYGVAVYSILGAEYVAPGVRAAIVGAIWVGVFTSGFGGAPRLIAAPSAPAAAVLASVAAGMIALRPAIGPGKALLIMALISLLTGALQTIYGLVGGGRMMKYIPFSVVSGYLSAVGVMIFLGQVPTFLGVKGGFLAAVAAPDRWSWPAIIVGTTSIVGMALTRKVTRRMPATVVALMAGTLVYLLLALIRPELLRMNGNPWLLGPIGTGSLLDPVPIASMFRGMKELSATDAMTALWPALTLSVLLSVDSLKSCVIIDTLTFSRHDSNRTLVGQGLGNVASAIAGGMPGSGVMGATLVNFESGGQTRRSGLFASLFVLGSFARCASARAPAQ